MKRCSIVRRGVVVALLCALAASAMPAAAQDAGDPSEQPPDTAPAEAVSVSVGVAAEDASFERTKAPDVTLFEDGTGTTEEPAPSEAPPTEAAPLEAESAAQEESDSAEEPWWPGMREFFDADSAQDTATQAQDGADAAAGGQETPDPLSPGVSYSRGLFALCVVLALILICYALVKRFGKGSPLFAGSSLANVLGRVHLDPRSSLHFVRVGSKVLVVGVTRNGISRIAELDAETIETRPAPKETPETTESPEAAEPPDEPGQRFAAHLQERTRRMLERESADEDEFDDSEIVSLRDDIQRLQQTLRDPASEADDE